MKTASAVWLLLVGAIFLTLACNRDADPSNWDKTINVSDNDPEMNAAIGKARNSLPQFWQVFEHPTRGESDFFIKVRIKDANGTEHFWITDIERKDGHISGRINNDPNIVKNVKDGDRIEIPQQDISDWMYYRDGKMVGNR